MSEGEYPFHPIVKLPEEYWVFDFTKPTNTTWQCPLIFALQISYVSADQAL